MTKFGLQTVPAYPAAADATAEFDHQLAQMRAAIEAGFDSLWIPQHYLAAPFQYLQTVPVLGRIAGEFSGVTIGTCVLLLPLTHPVQVAEEMTTLDIISRGRLILGVGAGYSELEMRALGLDPTSRLGRYAEGLRILRQLWTGEPVSFAGKHYQLDTVQLSLKPVQQPHPPIWIGAQGEPAIRRAARLGESWIAPPRGPTALRQRLQIYQEARAEAGLPLPDELPVRVDVFLAENAQDALEQARPSLEATHGAFDRWGLSRVDPEEGVSGKPYEEWARERMFVGDPNDCLERLTEYQTIGFNHIIVRAHFPGIDPEHALRTIHLLGQHVVPALKG